MMLGGPKGVFALARLWGSISVWLLHRICGLRLEYRGVENIPPGAVLIAAKHQSFLETFALLKYAPDFAIILKRQLTFIPFFGLYLIVSKQIAIDRSRGRRALQQIVTATKPVLAAGRQVFIYPEGTRRPSRSAATIQAWRRGALWRDGRSLPAGGRQYRALLETPHVPTPPRRRGDRISAADCAGARSCRLHQTAGNHNRGRLRLSQFGSNQARSLARGAGCGRRPVRRHKRSFPLTQPDSCSSFVPTLSGNIRHAGL